MKASDYNKIVNAQLAEIFCFEKDILTEKELIHILNTMDYSCVEEKYLVDEPGLYKFIKWDRLDKMQTIRAAARNLEIIKFVDFKKFVYRIRDIFFLIKRDYNILFDYFNFDFNNMSQDDAYFLLCLGQKRFFDMLDIKKFKFNFIETLNIIRAFHYKRDIILSLDYKQLKNYQVTEIIILSGEENSDLFDLNEINTIQWLDILPYQPDFIEFCDFEKFVSGDPFNLIQLVIMFDNPDLTYLIDRIDKSLITPFGWEKLLISKPEYARDICDFSKLNESNWSAISEYNPELLVHKL